MNIRLVLFSGLITAGIGAVVGLAAAKIGQRDFNQLRYEGQSYQELYKSYALIGAGLGFAAGVGQECLWELKAQRDREQ
jgi:hypothetical protein